MMHSNEIVAALRKRYPDTNGEYVTACEVSESTGAWARRRCDFLALSCWPSRGLRLTGVEIKVSRSDWRAELKNPAKVEEGVFRYCDEWYVAAPAGIVERGELPPTWGLLEVGSRGGCKVSVPAPVLTPQPMEREFIAAFVRTAGKAHVNEREVAVQQEVTRRMKSVEEARQREVGNLRREMQEQEEALTAFQQGYGRSITYLSAEEATRLGRLARFLDADSSTSWRLRSIEEAARTVLEGAEKIRGELVSLPTETGAAP